MFDQTHDCNCAHCCLPTIVQERDEAMARLERACDLLAMCDGWISADPEDASHFVELAQVRAFLAGEVPRG